MHCMCWFRDSQPSALNQLTADQFKQVIPLYFIVTPEILSVNPTKNRIIMIAVLTKTAATPITDIFCRIPIYFFKIKKRLTIIPAIVTIMRTNYPTSYI